MATESGQGEMESGATRPSVPLLDRLLRVGAILLLATMLVVTFLQVVARYFVFLNWQFGWTEEVSRLLLVWVTFLGAALLQQNDGHIRLSLLTRVLGPGGQSLLRLVGDLVMIGFLLIIAVQGYRESVEALDQTTPALQAPFTLFTASLWLCGLAMLFYTLRDACATIRTWQGREGS